MKKVSIGLVGVGRLGQQHAENLAFNIPHCELTAVCSINEADVQYFKEKLNIPNGYTSYEEMLRNRALDAIFIASPSNFHCEHIVKALDAGFHVFSEKPLGINLEEVLEIQEAVERNVGQVFMLGFMRRYDKSYAAAKQKIDKGEIGMPTFIKCYGIDPAKEMDNFLKYASKNDSGGIFLDMAIHELDLARWFLNAEGKEVWALGSSHSRPEFKKIHDVELGTAMIRFDNEAAGVFVVGRNSAHGYHVETEIIGTKGSIRIGSSLQRDEVVLLSSDGIIKESHGGFLERFEEAYLNEAKEFVSCILEGRQPEITVHDGVKATKLAYACKESLETSKRVRL